MKVEVKEKWLAALRGGEYQQGQGALRGTDGKFCCLGVLCDVYARETGAEWGDVKYGVVAFRNEVNFPPHEVLAWAELNSLDPVVSTPLAPTGKINVSLLNDGEGPFNPQSFKAIADLIEASL